MPCPQRRPRVIESTMKDGVAVLAMRHGKVNALDTELCQALCGALDDAAAAGAAAVVLTGAGPVFSAGVDLKRVMAGREGYVAAFLPELRRAFTRLATVELPVVAAVNGHAIAGGFILVAAADWAVMAEGPGRRDRAAGRRPVPGRGARAAAAARWGGAGLAARPERGHLRRGGGTGPWPGRRGRARGGAGRPLAGRRRAAGR